MAADRRFRAMGSNAHVVVVGADAEAWADRAVARIEDLEAKWSRFRVDSEVSRLNRSGGEPLLVSADTAGLVQWAIEAWRHSAGLVDCTLLEPLIAAGYDGTFEDLPPRRSGSATATVPTSLRGPTDIEVSGTTVRLPLGIGFDPGGIGKGLAADLVSAELLAGGAEGVCVNLGGDLRLAGVGPRGGTWTASIDHPHRAAPLALVGLAQGAIATSTTLRRRWSVGDEDRHHLIDPHTRAPSTSDLVFVSAVAGSGWEAEVLAKAVLLRGGPHPFDLVDGTTAQAVVVDRDGWVRATAGFAALLGGRPLPARIGAGVAA